MPQIRGIDVSNHNFKAGLDLEAIASQFDFCYVKATGGYRFVDPYCDRAVQTLKRLGKPWGFYHFAHDSYPSDAITEADFFVKSCSNYFGEGVPFLDWESSGVSVAWVNEFVKRVHDKTGVWCIIYAPYSWFINAKSNGEELEPNCGKWPAHYGKVAITSIQGSPDYSLVKNCPPFMVGWQFTSSGRLSGFNGNLDCNIFYGTADQWKLYAKGDREETPPSDDDSPLIVEDDQYKVTVEKK